jgi:uncharacterized membrane protein
VRLKLSSCLGLPAQAVLAVLRLTLPLSVPGRRLRRENAGVGMPQIRQMMMAAWEALTEEERDPFERMVAEERERLRELVLTARQDGSTTSSPLPDQPAASRDEEVRTS